MFVETHAHAFYRLTEHSDETHAEVLALTDELLAISPARAREWADLDALDASDAVQVSTRR